MIEARMAEPAPTARTLTFAKRLGLVLGSLVLTLLGAEIVVRSLGLTPSRYVRHRHVESEDKRWALDAYPENPRDSFPLDLRDTSVRTEWHERGLMGLDEISRHTPFAVPMRYSEELCRGGALPRQVDSNAPRVLIVGDSFTEGQGVIERDTFPARLQAQHPDWVVMNCARRGYDFPRLAEWLDLRIDLEPDLVIYALVLNDPEQSPEYRAQQGYLNDWILDRRRTVDAPEFASTWRLQLLDLLNDRIEAMRVGAATTRWYQGMVGQPNAQGWSRTLEHLSHMQATASAHQSRFLVALWPLLTQLEHYPFASTHRSITRDVSARGIEVLDTLPSFAGQTTERLWVHPIDHHPNGEAQRLFAEAVEPTVSRLLRAGAND